MADLNQDELEALSNCVGLVRTRLARAYSHYGGVDLDATVAVAVTALEKLERPSGDKSMAMLAFTATAHVEVALPVKEEDEERMREYVEALMAQAVGELEDTVRNKERGEIGRLEINVKKGQPWQS